MSKQVDVNELIPNTLKDKAREFVDGEYMQRNHDETLPPIRTRYEAYGKMAEGVQNVIGAMEGVKSGMKDCLKALNGMDTGFCSAAEATYSSLLDVMIAVGEMATQTLNCVYKISDLIAAMPTPLETLAENIDDEDLPEAENATEDEEEEGF
jgi:hypothetical protein